MFCPQFLARSCHWSRYPVAFCWLAIAAVAVGLVPVAAAADLGPGLASTPQLSSGELQLALDQLQVLGSVLYIAAHPDDENTALLAWLARGQHLRTGYLSLTRGDGGQNLIGAEKGAALGVIRTQELLAARRLDGAEQFFTRAIDYGYSKSAAEAFTAWDREALLEDVVWVLRNFRPDVVITRFPGDGRGRHGQHTASAQLAAEAFDAAADANRFTDQMAHVEPWQAKRLLWNNWRGALGRDEPVDETRTFEVDVGGYSPLLGRSLGELAAASRSQHKSQGFGTAAQRGRHSEALEHRAGEQAESDLLQGIDTSWARIPRGAEVGRRLAAARAAFDPHQPSVVVPQLLDAAAELAQLDHPWARYKQQRLTAVIAAASGLWLDVKAAAPTVAKGEAVELTITALARSPLEFEIVALEMPTGPVAAFAGRHLQENRPLVEKLTLQLSPNTPASEPYWLRQPADGALFSVPSLALRGRAENPLELSATWSLKIAGQLLSLVTPIKHRWVDPAIGELERPLQVVPKISLRVEPTILIAADSQPREVQVTLNAGTARAQSGQLRLTTPPGWRIEPTKVPFTLATDGGESRFTFSLIATAAAEPGQLSAIAESAGRGYHRQRLEIDYPHIPPQSVLRQAAAQLVPLEIEIGGREIGYVMGPGDEVPAALEQLGYRITLLSDEDLASNDLDRFDAVVTGVRAYNTRPRLKALQQRLLDWVASGGVLVMQYNTAHGLVTEELGPFPLRLSRDRVTVEEAPVTLLSPQHPLLNSPNRITAEDFAHWVQERGLYFPGEWDRRYQPLLASADPGEEPLIGGLLWARHGEGVFIYTGYSFFRQLPAGVPGAYRLFANLLAGGR